MTRGVGGLCASCNDIESDEDLAEVLERYKSLEKQAKRTVSLQQALDEAELAHGHLSHDLDKARSVHALNNSSASQHQRSQEKRRALQLFKGKVQQRARIKQPEERSTIPQRAVQQEEQVQTLQERVKSSHQYLDNRRASLERASSAVEELDSLKEEIVKRHPSVLLLQLQHQESSLEVNLEGHWKKQQQLGVISSKMERANTEFTSAESLLKKASRKLREPPEPKQARRVAKSSLDTVQHSEQDILEGLSALRQVDTFLMLNGCMLEDEVPKVAKFSCKCALPRECDCACVFARVKQQKKLLRQCQSVACQQQAKVDQLQDKVRREVGNAEQERKNCLESIERERERIFDQLRGTASSSSTCPPSILSASLTGGTLSMD